ncbi:MAG: ABC-three component system middle component 6, partial [archaeon]
LGIGAILLNNLGRSQTVSMLWEKVRGAPSISNFERFTLGLAFLYLLGAIELKAGLISKVSE